VLKPFLTMTVGLAVFVIVGAAVSSVMIRRQSSTVELLCRLTEGGEAQGDEAVAILRERAAALAGGLGISRWEITREGPEVRVSATARRGLETFAETLLRRGLVSFHEGAPATGPNGPLECPEGFRAASFSDYIFRTKGDFGERVVRRTDLFVREEPEIEIAGLDGCTYHTEGIFRAPVVTLEFRPADAERFAGISERLKGKLLAVCVDGEVRAAALLAEAITGGRVQMRGLRDKEVARTLAAILRAGALPCALECLSVPEACDGR